MRCDLQTLQRDVVVDELPDVTFARADQQAHLPPKDHQPEFAGNTVVPHRPAPGR